MNIDYQLRQNAFEDDFNNRQATIPKSSHHPPDKNTWFEDDFNNRQATIRQPREEEVQTVVQNRSEDSVGSGLGLFNGIGSSFDMADAEADREMAEILGKKKKAKRKRGMRL